MDGAVGGNIAMFDREGQRPGVWRGVLKGKVDVILKRGERKGSSDGLIYADGKGKVPPPTSALFQFIWADQFGEPGLFSGPRLTDLYRRPSMSTFEPQTHTPQNHRW